MGMTDGQLYDHVHRLFGIGDWDDDSDVPYHRYRGIEVHKVKLTRTKRGASCEELAIAADYCKAHHKDIRNVSWLYKHLRDAAAWHAERERALATADLDELIREAIDLEIQESGTDSPWVDQLIRARGPHREEVLQSWRTWRQSSSSGPAAASSASTPRPG